MTLNRIILSIALTISATVLNYDLSAQKWHLFTEAGIVEPLEVIEDDANSVTWSINTSPVLIAGLQFRKRRIQQSFGYHFMNYWTTQPRWIDENLGGVSTGPNHIHSLFYRVGVDLRKKKRKVTIIPNLQIRLGYIPDNVWDNNAVPNDSSLFGSQSIGMYHNGDTVALFTSRGYDRLMSDVLFNVAAAVEIRFFNHKRLNLSLIPQASKGLVVIHQADSWYRDHVNGKSGHATLTARGSHLGLLMKLTLRIRK